MIITVSILTLEVLLAITSSIKVGENVKIQQCTILNVQKGSNSYIHQFEQLKAQIFKQSDFQQFKK